jgi:hypothetical protein
VRSAVCLRAPQLAAAAAVVVVAVLAAACGGADTAREAPQPPSDRPATPVPRSAARYVHEEFHRLPRWCARGRTDRRRLDNTTARFLDLYRRYPAERFRMTIDDESGTMLSAILVLRAALYRCSPRHAALVDSVLPRRVRRALPPLRPLGW